MWCEFCHAGSINAKFKTYDNGAKDMFHCQMCGKESTALTKSPFTKTKTLHGGVKEAKKYDRD